MTLKIFLLFTFSFATVLTFSSNTYAQDNKISVSPVTKTIDYNNATSTSYNLLINNQSENEYSLDINIFEMITNEKIEFNESSVSNSVKANTNNSICAKYEQCVIEITVDNNLLTVDDKTHIIAIIIAFTPTANISNEIGTQQEIISMLNINLTNDIKTSSVVNTELISVSPSVILSPNFEFCLRIVNKSQLILYPIGYTKIENPNKINLNEVFSYQNTKGLKPSNNDEVCYNWDRNNINNLPLGKYTIKSTTYAISDQTNPVYSEISFIYIPWQIVAIISGILLIVTSGFIILKSNNRKKE